MSHQLSSQKEKRESEGLIYIGNSKSLQTSKPVSSSDVDDNLGDIPVREKNNQGVDDGGDLPF